MMERNELVRYLMAHDGYSSKGAEVAAEKYVNAAQFIKDAFIEYVESEKMQELSIEGYTMQMLVEKHNMKPLAAFLTLDWLSRSPSEAKKSLEKGHDRIGK